jgi:low temperature requirement protein LtrA
MSVPGRDAVASVSTDARRGVRAAGPQAVTFVELFFDLVFVFAVTQITAKTAHDLTPGGVFRAVLLGWLIWWAWTQFTWTLNPADTTHAGVRVLTLAATAAAFVMAASVPRAFTGEAIWFALPYVVVRGLGLGLQLVVEGDAANRTAATRWAGASVVGLVLVLAGALLDPGLRSWAWLAAIIADLAAATLAGRRGATWSLHPSHLAERHGLIVIIALGESLIVAGTAVAGEAISPGLLATVGAAIVVACLLWWTYFGWLKEALEHRFAAVAPDDRGALARDAFSLAHFPLIGGIVGFAVAIEETVAHPDSRARLARDRRLAVRGRVRAVAVASRRARPRRAAGGPGGDGRGARRGRAAAAGRAAGRGRRRAAFDRCPGGGAATRTADACHRRALTGTNARRARCRQIPPVAPRLSSWAHGPQNVAPSSMCATRDGPAFAWRSSGWGRPSWAWIRPAQ